jgi:lactate dehydrogenase-like 2-hydroxyacid dehydrogenase
MPEPSRLRVAITRALPDPVLAIVAGRHQTWVNPDDRALSPAELNRVAGQADVLLVTAFDRLDADAIAALPSPVRIIATYSVGLEHIDLEAARKKGIAVLFTPDVLSDSVAEMAILLMLGAARRAHEGAELLYSGRWSGWSPTQLVGIEVSGRRMGILGMGRIGRAIARRARGFEMTVHYHNRRRLPADIEDGAGYHADIDSLVAESDVLVLGAPSSSETRSVLNAARIDLMPEDAIVVNIARGDLIDDDALISALKSGRMASAGLDVFRGEPRLDPRYLELPNVYLQPHQGSSTMAARLRMGQILLDGIDALEAGRAPLNRIA